MKKFLIATNSIKDENLILTSKITDYITMHGGMAYSVVGDCKDGMTYRVDEKQDYDCIIALGGDGTILKAGRDLRHLDVPIVGVNLGTLGFLAEIEPEQIFPVIDRLLADDYEVEPRMNLMGKVYKKNQDHLIMEDIAINDIVVSRSGFSRIIGLKVFVNGNVIDIYEADGIIVSTPTGSTGYNMSAGGPIVSPKTNLMIVTPISPHSFTAKSMIFSNEDEVVIEVLKMRKAQEEEAIVSFDGQEGTKLSPGDKIVIKKANSVTNMVKLFDVNFVEVLREKMLNHF
ncbi:MAG: NAD(+)/NADH kinase [Lachnospiraceae bacterium]